MDDDIVLEHAFYDQDDILIKRLVTLEIDERGGRTVPTRQRMTNTRDRGTNGQRSMSRKWSSTSS